MAQELRYAGNNNAEPRAARIFNPSAFGLLLLFGLTAYSGANILRFEALTQGLWYGPANQSLQSVMDSVLAWTDTGSVATLARSNMLDLIVAETPSDRAAIEHALEEIVSGSPSSTGTWQLLAEARKARGAPIQSVLAAFRMSALTGSHEGFFMRQRASFGLKYWSELPEEDRRTVIRDLLGSLVHSAIATESRYREILAAKSQAERENIRAALVASGRASKETLLGLGV